MKFITMLLCMVLPFGIPAQTLTENKKWDVSDPGGTYKEVSFTVNEGTWMNLDVSPDGKEIVFDLLGDIYSLPVVMLLRFSLVSALTAKKYLLLLMRAAEIISG